MNKRKRKQKFVLEEKHRVAAKLFAEGYTKQAIAFAMGVHRTTVQRWFQHEEVYAYSDKCLDRIIRAKTREIKREAERKSKEILKKLDSLSGYALLAYANKILDRFSPW